MFVTKEALFEGKTIDDAIQHGLSALSLERDNISVEVIATPVKGIFGIGGSPAKVKLTYEVEEQAPPVVAPPTSVPVQRPASTPMQKSAPVQKTAPVAQKPAPTALKPQQKPAPKPEQKPKPAPRVPRPVTPVNTAPFAPVENSAAQRFLGEVFDILQMTVTVDASTNGETLKLNLNGDSMGILIGRHGETLDAFQYLTGLVENNSEDNFEKVYLDIQGYRAKREETLVALANRVADKVKRYGKNITLEAMNPYERRIIHATLQDVAGISTFSVGFEPNRKIVVAYGEKKNK